MSFDTPWVPSLNGNNVRPCEAISELVEDDIKPNPDNDVDRPWSARAIRENPEVPPMARKAMIECALSLWRLKVTAEKGGDDPIWVDNVVAWLVCGLDFVIRSRSLTSNGR